MKKKEFVTIVIIVLAATIGFLLINQLRCVKVISSVSSGAADDK